MSHKSSILELNSSPCDSCPLSNHCATMLKCCSSMTTFIESGVCRNPTIPTQDLFDKVYGEQYASNGFQVLNRGQYLNSLNMDGSLKSSYCDNVMTELYNSSSDHELNGIPKDLYADWHWLIAVSKTRIAPMVMGAMAYEMHGDGTYVSYLYVRKYYQGMGIGSSLLNIIEKHTADKVVLLPEDESSHRWYESRGYSVCQEMDMAWEKQIG